MVHYWLAGYHSLKGAQGTKGWFVVGNHFQKLIWRISWSVCALLSCLETGLVGAGEMTQQCILLIQMTQACFCMLTTACSQLVAKTHLEPQVGVSDTMFLYPHILHTLGTHTDMQAHIQTHE